MAIAGKVRKCVFGCRQVIAVVSLLAFAPVAQAQTATTFEISVRNNQVSGGSLSTPARGAPTLRLKQGDQIELRWTVDTAMDLHLHGCNVEARAAPGQATSLKFLARATGRFPVETHDPCGRHSTILYVEVHPR